MPSFKGRKTVTTMYETLLSSLLITFRETLEAALIVTIMITYLRKTGKEEYSGYAYGGVGAALLLSLLLGYGVQAVYGSLGETQSQVFEGVASLTAVIVLTYMIMWMSGHGREIKGSLESKMDISLSQGELLGIAFLAFIAVFREGLETVLFLSAAFVQDSSGTIVGVISGSGVVLVLSVLLMKGTVNLEISKFFKVSNVLLIILAAGLAGYGVHELIEAGEGIGVNIGWWAQKPFNINPPINLDGSYPFLHEKGVIGSILKTLVGYDGDPEWLRILVYLGYWSIVGFFLLRKSRN